MGVTMKRFLWIAIACLLLAACSSNGAASTKTLATPSVTPLNKTSFNPVVLIVMENLSAAQAEKVTYLSTLMQTYAYARNYTAITHPSLPNYIALTSGDTHGITTDCQPGPNCQVPGTVSNLGNEMEAAGVSWKAYLEGMPGPCTLTNEDLYAVKHNPFVYYDDIRTDAARCQAHDVPFTEFQTDLAAGSLPDFAWISPDLCNDMHTKCGYFSSRTQQGDSWLRQVVPAILAAPQFKDNGLLIITFDEGTGNAGCCGAPGGGGVLTLLISNKDTLKSDGYVSDIPYNHYSLLRTLEDNWGLSHLGHSADPDVQPMSDFFSK